MTSQDHQDYQDDQDVKQETTHAHAHKAEKVKSRPDHPARPGRAFTVYQDRFPFDGPLELTTITAASQADAAAKAKARWPGKRLLVREAGRARSPSSTAYRAFIASKRDAASAAKHTDRRSA